LRKNNLSRLLDAKLRSEELKLVYKSYDIIGDIAVIRVPKKLAHQSTIIAEAILQLHNNVKAVWRQSSAVSGRFRLRKLEYLVGESRTLTAYKEHGCIFSVDLKNCFFSPRLSHERMRIARLIHEDEVILNMFAGVGSFSIIIAKHSQADRVYSIDVNPAAVGFMRENILLNHVLNRVIPIEGDSKTIIKERLRKTADRILMPLPEKAFEYLDYGIEALKPEGGWVHYYDFEHAGKGESAVSKVEAKVSQKLLLMGVSFSIPFSRIVRDTGPRRQQVVLDVQIFGKD
jgi:tRNA (guanine37-N1)-methyltransferase